MPWTPEQNKAFSQEMSECWYTSLKEKPGLGVQWIERAKRFPFDIAMKALEEIWENQEGRQTFLPGIKTFLDAAKSLMNWRERCAPVASVGGGVESGEHIITLPYYYVTTLEHPELYMPKDPEQRQRRREFMERTKGAVLHGASFSDILTGRVGKAKEDDEVPF
jgi:hypothetical protein